MLSFRAFLALACVLLLAQPVLSTTYVGDNPVCTDATSAGRGLGPGTRGVNSLSCSGDGSDPAYSLLDDLTRAQSPFTAGVSSDDSVECAYVDVNDVDQSIRVIAVCKAGTAFAGQGGPQADVASDTDPVTGQQLPRDGVQVCDPQSGSMTALPSEGPLCTVDAWCANRVFELINSICFMVVEPTSGNVSAPDVMQQGCTFQCAAALQDFNQRCSDAAAPEGGVLAQYHNADQAFSDRLQQCQPCNASITAEVLSAVLGGPSVVNFTFDGSVDPTHLVRAGYTLPVDRAACGDRAQDFIDLHMRCQAPAQQNVQAYAGATADWVDQDSTYSDLVTVCSPPTAPQPLQGVEANLEDQYNENGEYTDSRIVLRWFAPASPTADTTYTIRSSLNQPDGTAPTPEMFTDVETDYTTDDASYTVALDLIPDAGKTRWFVVVAKNSIGDSQSNLASYSTPGQPLDAPASITVGQWSADTRQLTLTWDAVTDTSLYGGGAPVKYAIVSVADGKAAGPFPGVDSQSDVTAVLNVEPGYSGTVGVVAFYTKDGIDSALTNVQTASIAVDEQAPHAVHLTDDPDNQIPFASVNCMDGYDPQAAVDKLYHCIQIEFSDTDRCGYYDPNTDMTDPCTQIEYRISYQVERADSWTAATTVAHYGDGTFTLWYKDGDGDSTLAAPLSRATNYRVEVVPARVGESTLMGDASNVVKVQTLGEAPLFYTGAEDSAPPTYDLTDAQVEVTSATSLKVTLPTPAMINNGGAMNPELFIGLLPQADYDASQFDNAQGDSVVLGTPVYEFSGLAPSVQYHIEVAAANGDLFSDSKVLSFTMPMRPVHVLNATAACPGPETDFRVNCTIVIYFDAQLDETPREVSQHDLEQAFRIQPPLSANYSGTIDASLLFLTIHIDALLDGPPAPMPGAVSIEITGDLYNKADTSPHRISAAKEAMPMLVFGQWSMAPDASALLPQATPADVQECDQGAVPFRIAPAQQLIDSTAAQRVQMDNMTVSNNMTLGVNIVISAQRGMLLKQSTDTPRAKLELSRSSLATLFDGDALGFLYAPPAGGSGFGFDSVRIELSGQYGEVSIIPINVRRVNQPPVVTVPAQPIVFNLSAYTPLTGISIVDPDADQSDTAHSQYRVQYFNMQSNTNLFMLSEALPDGVRSPDAKFNEPVTAFTLTGTLAALNAYLPKVQYSDPGADVDAPQLSFSMSVSDQGQGTRFADQPKDIIVSVPIRTSCASAAAPTIKTIQLSNDLGALTIEFAGPVARVPPSATCGQFFESSTMALLGADAQCMVTGPTTMVVVLGAGPTIKRDSKLNIRAGNPLKRCEDAGAAALAAGETDTIKAPIVPPMPDIPGVIYQPTIGPCDDMTARAITPSNLGGQPAVYTWSALGVKSDFLPRPAVSPDPDVLVIPGNKFAVDKPVTLQLIVTNWWGVKSKPYQFTVTKQAKAAPSFVPINPLALDVTTDATFQIGVEPDFPQCLNQGSGAITYVWTIAPAPLTPLDAATITSPVLSVFPGQLRGGQTYMLNVTASYTGADRKPSITTLSFTLRAKYSSIAAVLPSTQSTDVLSSYEMPIQLIDADRMGGNWSFTFRCAASTASGTCLSQPNARGKKEQFDQKAFEQNLRIDASNGMAYLTIPARALDVGSYTFSLKPKQAFRDVAGVVQRDTPNPATTVLAVSPAPQPRLTLQAITPTTINARDAIVLTSALAGMGTADDSMLTYAWSCASLDLTDATLIGQGSASASSLVLNTDGAYAFQAGSSLTFRLVASYPAANLTASAELVIQINRPPASGLCKVDPASGVTGNTTFTVSCERWSSAVGGLKYQFFAVHPLDGSLIALGDVSSAPRVSSSRLPPGHPCLNNTLTLRAEITDAMNGRTVFDSMQAVVAPGDNPSTPDESAQKLAVAKGNPAELMSSIAADAAAANSALNAPVCPSSTTAVARRLLGAGGPAPPPPPPLADPTKRATYTKQAAAGLDKGIAKFGANAAKSQPSLVHTTAVTLTRDPTVVSPASLETTLSATATAIGAGSKQTPATCTTVKCQSDRSSLGWDGAAALAQLLNAVMSKNQSSTTTTSTMPPKDMRSMVDRIQSNLTAVLRQQAEGFKAAGESRPLLATGASVASQSIGLSGAVRRDRPDQTVQHQLSSLSTVQVYSTYAAGKWQATKVGNTTTYPLIDTQIVSYSTSPFIPASGESRVAAPVISVKRMFASNPTEVVMPTSTGALLSIDVPVSLSARAANCSQAWPAARCFACAMWDATNLVWTRPATLKSSFKQVGNATIATCLLNGAATQASAMHESTSPYASVRMQQQQQQRQHSFHAMAADSTTNSGDNVITVIPYTSSVYSSSAKYSSSAMYSSSAISSSGQQNGGNQTSSSTGGAGGMQSSSTGAGALPVAKSIKFKLNVDLSTLTDAVKQPSSIAVQLQWVSIHRRSS